MSSILAYLEIDFRAGNDFPLGALSIFTLLYRAEHATILRDNVNMLSGHKDVCYYNITIFGVATPSRHRYINIFRIISGP